MLYDLVQCPHRVTMDLFEDFSKRDPINPFVQLLWEKGNAFEQEVIEELQVPFVNLRPFSDQEREQMTKGAMLRVNEVGVKPASPPEGRRIKNTAGKPARLTAGKPKLLTIAQTQKGS